MSVDREQQRIARLLEVGRSLATELDLGVVLDRILETVQEVTGARYATLRILGDEYSEEPAQFLTSGFDAEETLEEIGELPRGRGFLDAPVVVGGQVCGNLQLYRGEQGGEFGAQDRQAAATLADWAAIAIDKARLYETSELRDRQLRSARSAADAERRRWARELHDEALRALGGIHLLLSEALRDNDLQVAQAAMRETVAQIEQELENLRSIPTELRPTPLDESYAIN